MNKTWKRIVSVIMALAMVVLCLPGYANPVKTAKAGTPGVAYIDDKGETQTYKGTYHSIRGDGNTNPNRPSTWNEEWYVVEPYNGGTIAINSRVTVGSATVKTVNLILKDGAILRANNGITVPDGVTLNIYAQSTGSDMGQLIAGPQVNNNYAGIGGAYSNGRTTATGKIIINGGNITAYSDTKGYAAAIGGARNGGAGEIIINGGIVTAIARSDNTKRAGAAIGNGSLEAYASLKGNSSITINGGTVNATGVYNGSAIGSGYDPYSNTHVNNFGTITINGGTVNATAGSGVYSTAIGGYFGSESIISISKGKVTATMVTAGQTAIGGAIDSSTSANIKITGGTVVAKTTLTDTSDINNSVGIGNGHNYTGSAGSVSIDFTDTSSVKAFNYKGNVTLVNGAIIQESETEIDAGRVSNLTQIANVTLVKKVPKKYTITWLDDEGNVIDTTTVNKGTVPTHSDPIKASTAEYDYTFAGWTPTVVAATKDTSYTATFTSKKRSYTVKFVDENGIDIIDPALYEYNTAVADITIPADPKKDSSESEDFTFSGWLNTTTNTTGVESVTGNVTYKAQFTSSARKYTVSFVDENGVNIVTPAQYPYGTEANAITVPDAPAKDPSTEQVFAFAGWLNTTTNETGIKTVTGDVTYQATYTGSPRPYTISFVDEDGTPIGEEKTYDYGTSANEIDVPADPFKDADENYVYTFSGWSPAVSDVTGNQVYTAEYSKTDRPYTNVEVSIVWDDDDNRDDLRPSEVRVDLLANGTFYTSETLSGNAWSYTFTVPTNDNKGNPNTYTISANSVDEYTKTVDGYTITYKHTPEKTEASVRIVWEDSNNAFGTRPEYVSFFLDGSASTDATLCDEDGWATTVSDLLKFENGTEIDYSWNASEIPGYELTDTTKEGNTTTFTYTLITVTVSGTVTWNMQGYSEELIPDSITVQILNGTEVADTITVTPGSNATSWTFESKELPKYADGGEAVITYTVNAANVPESFETVVNGTNIVNTYIPALTTIEGEVIWDLKGNSTDLIPSTLPVSLLAGGEVIDTIDVEADDDGKWNFKFEDLPKFASDGTTEIAYTISSELAGFDTTIEGTTITNTLKTVRVSGEITWSMQGYDETLIPESITVYIKSGNDTVDTLTVTAGDSNDWTFESKDLPKYESDGETEITYTVDEEVPDGFRKTVSETTILNTYIPETGTVSGEVTWELKGNDESLIPDEVTVYIKDGNTTVETITLDTNGSETVEFTSSELPKYRTDGQTAIVYTVDEAAVTDFIKAVNGMTITNTLDTIDFAISVSWEDADDQDGYRPDDVTIQLKVGEEIIDQVDVPTDDNAYTFENLPKTNGGEELAYYIEGAAVTEYSVAKVSATSVKYTHTPEKTEVSVVTVWTDADDQDGYRPDDVTVNLLADGNIIETVALSGENNWSRSWTNLDKKANGVDIDYTVTEIAVDKYTTNIVKTAENTFSYTITNTHTPETVEVTISKVWDDNDNIEGFRANEVTVHVMNGTKAVETAVLGENNSWTWTFTNLPKKANGVDIIYTATEDEVANYGSRITPADDGTFTFTVTNSRTVEKTSVSVEKIWDDTDNAEGFRPNSVTIKLLADGREAGTATPDTDNNWEYTWTDLQKFAEGKEIVYTVSEDQLANYKTPVIEKVSETEWSYTVTNSRDLEVTEATVKTVWVDADDQDGYRPESLTVKLLANGGETNKSVTLNEENGWEAKLTGLQKYADHEEIEYTWVEEGLSEKYSLTNSETVETITTLTNSHTPEETEATVKVIWNLDAKEIKNPPEALTVALSDGQTVELNAENNWSATIEHLPKYRNHGEEIEYTWEEVDLPEGYELADTSKDGTITTLTNTYYVKPTRLPLEATKILTGRMWTEEDNFEFTLAADENNPDGAVLPTTTVKYADINNKSVVFDDIAFNKYGTFKFTITETEGNIKGVTYDTEPKEFTVVIKDDGIGTLYVDSVTNDGYVEIKNPYESCGEIQFFAKKIMIGRELAEGQYTFALKDEDGNTLQTASCDAEGKVTFAPITYSEDDMVVDGKIVTERQYTYTISEVKPEGDELDKAVIYDGAVKEITVTLTDDQEGTITTDPETGDLGITFINTVVRIQKTDVSTGEELTGAHLKILDKTGTVIDEWDSETGKPHEVENLKTDEEYTLKETITPKDYTFAADAIFSVDKDGKITTNGLKEREDGVLLLENKLAEKPTLEVKTQDVNDTTGETSGWQDSADYDNGDEVPFRLTAILADNVTDYRAYKIIFHDTMDAGLTFKSIDKVTVGGQELSSNDYSIDSDDNSFDLTILWNNSDGRIADESLNEAVIEVLFTAVLNENAELGMEGNSNVCTLEYSCNPNVSEDDVPSDETEETDADSVIVFTYGIEMTVSGESGEAVDDAEFELVKKVDGNELTVATVTVVDGQVSFVGIDDGEYILKQTNVPDKTVGIDPISFTVSAEHSAVWEEPEENDTVLSALDGNVTEGDLTLTADESYSILSGDITLQTISYKITFCDENGNVLSSEEYKNGTKAADVSIPKAPEKQSDDEKNYVFSAWVNATTNVSGVADVTEEATYKATYTDSSRKYVITFVNEDGTELQKSDVEYGKTPAYTGTTPTKAADDKYTYEFESWTPAIADVTADATYTAKYKATEIKKDPVKGVYKYIGDGAKYTKGSKKAITLIFKRTENDEITFEMFDGIKTSKGALVSGTHFTAKKGSVEITLLPEYLETLEVGKTSFTVSFKDGDPVTIELEVAPAQQQADTNPTTGDSMNMNYIWIICVIGAAALAIVLFVQIRRRREEEF